MRCWHASKDWATLVEYPFARFTIACRDRLEQIFFNWTYLSATSLPMNLFDSEHVSRPYRRVDVCILLIAALVAVAVFMIDAFTALDIAVAVFYVVVLLLVASTGSRAAVLSTGAAVAILTLAGFGFSHDTDYSWDAVARCVVSLVAIGTTSLLSLRNLTNTAQLRELIDLLNLTHDAIFVYDLTGSITFWNNGAETLYGWPAEHAIGQHIDKLTQTRFPNSETEIYAALVDRGHWAGELQRVCRDGRHVTVVSRIALWRDAKGKPRAILATNNDITLQKRMEMVLSQRQQELRAAIDTIPGMVWSASNEGEVVFVNRRWEESGMDTGTQGADLWQAIVHPDDLDRMRCDWQISVASGRALDNVSRVRQRDGDYRWMHIAAEPQYDDGGAVRRWYGVNTDIEARKIAEEALKRSEAFLVDAQRLSKTGSIGISPVNGDMLWSSEAYRIFGYEQRPEIEPSLELILARTHPDDRAKVEAAHQYSDAIAPLIDIEYRLLLPDGLLKYVHYVAHLGPPASTDLAYVGALMDITDGRQTQEALARSMAELAHVTRMTTLGELAASIAHEVTQPIAAVVTSGDAALRWLRRDPPKLDEVERSVGQMIKSVKRANEIVRQIRAMAQKRPAPRREVFLDDAVDGMVQLMAPEFQRQGVHCEVHRPIERPRLLADEVQLQQVVINLLMNAMQAMSGLENGPRLIRICTEVLEGREVRLSIQDSGPGIAFEDREQLFRPFFTTKANGMGMGLSICRSIVEAHGGNIGADVASVVGAVFRITLPLYTGPQESRGTAAMNGALSGPAR